MGESLLRKSVVSLTYDGIVQTKGLRLKSTNCEMRSVGWLLERDYEPTGIIDLMDFRENIEASGFGILM